MANFPNRRAPNVSQYLANLNVIPSEHDQQQEQAYNVDNDLDMFTNAEFFNFDLTEGVNGTNNAVGDQAGNAEQKTGFGNGSGSGNRNRNPRDGLDFPSGEYPFGTAPIVPAGQHHGISPGVPQTSFSHDLTSPTYGTASSALDNLNYASPQSQSSPSFPPGHHAGSNADSTEESARLAAEEDKRRRNTAASARFRVKKKQREQALEKTAKELTDKVTALEGKIDRLQQENGWLRSLVVEKKGEEELAEKFHKFRRASEEVEDGDRSTSGKKKGVGTKAGKA